MRQPIWTPFEVALLIDAYRRMDNGCITKKDAVSEISTLFRNHAISLGIDIDSTYRNENGISLRFEELRYLFSDGNGGVKNTSSLFRIMVKMYQQNPQAFHDILTTAKTMFNDSTVQSSGESNSADSIQTRTGVLLDWHSYSLLAFTTPVKCTYSGKPVLFFKTWESLYVELIKEIYEDYPQEFRGLLIRIFLNPSNSLSSGIKVSNKTDAANLKKAAQIADDLYIETYHSPTDIVSNIKQLMDICEISYDEIKIYYRLQIDDQIEEDVTIDAPEEPEHDEIIEEVAIDDISDGIRQVLNQHFPYGFKLDSVRDLMRFRRFAEADAINNIPEDDDELKSKILSVGTVINEKLYAKREDLSEELRQIVKNIFSDGTIVIYYQALLEHEHEWMSSQHISSEEMLKELLQKYFPDCHHARRFMVNGKKQTEKDSLTAELKRVWGDTASRSVDDLSADLPYIPTDNIWRGISGSPHFSRVTEGIYFLNERLIITDEEADAILDYVESACDKDGFASLGDLPLESIEEVNYEIPLPTIQSAVYGRLLSDQYTLNGKILTKDNAELNSIVLLKQYLSEKESCTFAELAEKNLELTGVSNRKNVFQALYDGMVRVDANQFVTPSAVEFPIDEIDRVLSGLIPNHFCALREITTFALFPMCGQSWNHYLLESYCYRFSKHYSLSLINFNDKNAGIITEKDFGKSYPEMLAIAAARSDIELSPEAIGQYLFQNGYAAKSKFSQLSDVAAMAQTLRKEP